MYPARLTKKFLVLCLIVSVLAGSFFSVWREETRSAKAALQSSIVDIRISAGANDAEQRLSDGYMYLDSSDLELVNDPGVAKADQSIGMRFTGVSIPKGATITNAYVEFQVDEATSEKTSLIMHGEATDNAAIFTTSTKNITNRARTNASVGWNSLPTWSTVGAKVQSPAITSVIQEIVNRSGWTAGNSLVLFVDGSGRRVAKAYESSASTAPLLHVEYVPAGTTSSGTPPPPTPTATQKSPSPTAPLPTPTATLKPASPTPPPPTPTATVVAPTPTTITPVQGTALDVRVPAGANDAEQRLSDGYMYLSSSDLELVNDPGVAKGDQSIGMRFIGVSIPKGATIIIAYVEFQVDEATSETTSLVLRGEASDNAAVFTTSTKNITNRARTNASVGWNSLPTWSTVGAKVQSPAITSVIQEIVNRNGWAAGNSLVVFVDGSGRRVSKAYEASAQSAPLLHVVYTATAAISTTVPSPTPTTISTPVPSPTPTAPQPTPISGQPQPVGQSGSWNMVFDDEFSSSSLDTTKWHTCFWWADTTCSIESQHELELYNPQDVSVQNGLLVLKAQKRDMVAWNGTTYHYTSGMVMTGGRKGKITPGFTFTYGYAEARVKVPAGQGIWPAFWMLPANYSTRPEIDIMEILGNQPNVYHMNYHYIGGDMGKTWTGPDFSTGWHVLGIDWSPSAIVWYVDGVERWRYTDTANISKDASYLLLNLAVGGDWPGAPNSSTVFPSYYQIDYVRAWQK
jgi:beta-glucanase (GH16 family)